MAVTPHVNTANVKKFDGKPAKTTMVLKSNTLTHQLTAPVMKADKNVMSVQKFFKEKNLNPNDNMLIKKAPRRVAEADILSSKIAFFEQFEYDESSSSVVESNVFFYGGWDADLEKVEDGVYETCLYFTEIPFTVNVDLEANTAEMVMEGLAYWQWSDTTTNGRFTYINDTTEYLFIWDEAYMFDESEDAEPANLQGVVYDDGTIYFPDGWTLYLVDFTQQRVYRNGQMTENSMDTTAGLLCGFMRSTYLMTPTAKHTYVDTYDNSEGENSVYMFQWSADTVAVWNMFGLGNRGNVWLINEDGTAQFPNMQYGGDMASQRSYCETNYSSYDWTDADHVTFLGYDPTGGDDGTGAAELENPIEGTVTPEAITWDYLVWSWWGQNPSTGGWVYLSYPPFSNNALTFTNGDFFMLGTTATPVIETELNDDNVVVTAVPGDELEAEIILCIYDPENETLTPVDNPYTVERTDEDQTIIFAAIAQAYGKEASEWAVAEVTIPAKEITFLRGDVDNDGSVGIGDVTTLIDYILSKDPEGVNLLAADCDQDGSIGIGDVTALIDYILSKSWE